MPTERLEIEVDRDAEVIRVKVEIPGSGREATPPSFEASVPYRGKDTVAVAFRELESMAHTWLVQQDGYSVTR